MMRLDPLSCGTKGLIIFITKHFQTYKIWYVACPLFLLVKMKFVKNACLVKIQRKHFLAVIVELRAFYIGFIMMCVVPCNLPLLVVLYYVIFINDFSRNVGSIS
jgi:hypothetical protein